ncbi:GAF domain-containing protein [Candidatus Kryptobacter tengchongensis]|uniref:GAF domain-containing protein n=1 Tax=Kryptobacter tengchongensis TaxID=1643429 RepID=UPI0007074EF0|nr:GAF domain-containing protein [Candidatus Kryptobacter tengchongensis]CUS77851.1 diguanylate cyclase (GGDEF) domain-containing protein [Candidatus Kryptobacter tengchongensis]
MSRVENNPAKFIFLLTFVLISMFLIVAIDNKIVRLAFAFALLISLSLIVNAMILSKRKKMGNKISSYEDKQFEAPDEGFVIRKPEQGLSTSFEKLNPREEFKELLKKILLLIKKNIVADSVAFYWANEDKKQMVFEEGITDLGFNFVRRYNWDDDALSMVAKTGRPKLIGDINSSASEDVIKYQSPKAGSKSLLVHPVSYKNRTVGVILLDSRQTQTFSDDDVKNVGLFCELIANLIENYNGKFDLYYKARILEVVVDFEHFKIEELFLRIQNFAIKTLDCSAVAVVLFEDGKWVVAFGYSKLGKYIDAGTEIKLEGTLTGEVITSGVPRIIPSTRTHGKVFRFTDSEKINLESSIAVVPIRYGRKCYGAIVFEHPKNNFFSSYSDIKKLENLANIVGILLENDSLNELVENYFVYDEGTFLMKKNYFYSRLDEEIDRKTKHGGELSLILIKVDNIDYIKSTYGESSAEIVQPYIASIIREHLNKYDLAGKLEDNLIGVALVESGPNEAYIWAEKLRKVISNQEIKFKDRSFSVTITAGVSAWDREKNADEFVEKVKKSFLKNSSIK